MWQVRRVLGAYPRQADSAEMGLPLTLRPFYWIPKRRGDYLRFMSPRDNASFDWAP